LITAQVFLRPNIQEWLTLATLIALGYALCLLVAMQHRLRAIDKLLGVVAWEIKGKKEFAKFGEALIAKALSPLESTPITQNSGDREAIIVKEVGTGNIIEQLPGSEPE